jgi:hypothetical protein
MQNCPVDTDYEDLIETLEIPSATLMPKNNIHNLLKFNDYFLVCLCWDSEVINF